MTIDRDYHLKCIEDCISRFNFERVQRCMKLMNWKWVNSKTETQVPSVYELIETSRRLLVECIDQLDDNPACGYVATGGLEASIEMLDGEYFYTLKFVVEDSIYPIV